MEFMPLTSPAIIFIPALYRLTDANAERIPEAELLAADVACAPPALTAATSRLIPLVTTTTVAFMVVVVMVLAWFPVVCTMVRICILDAVTLAVIFADPDVIAAVAIAIVVVTLV